MPLFKSLLIFCVIVVLHSAYGDTPNDNRLNFNQRALALGVAHSHQQLSKTASAITDTLAGGVCIFDYNNDGWMDFFVVGGSGQTRYYGKQSWWHQASGNGLFKNNAGNGFSNVTTQAGLDIQNWGMGCSTGDLDNDGDDELLLTALGKNSLFNNNGNGSFNDISTSSGINKKNSWSTSATLADFNRDGLIDVYVGNFIHFEKGANTFEALKGFSASVPVNFNAQLYDAQSNHLYLNSSNENGISFSEQGKQWSVENSAGRTLSVTAVDINHDNHSDIMVLNSAGSANQIFINQQGKGFVESAEKYHLQTSQGSHGLSVGDIDHNGFIDIVVNTPVGSAPIEIRQHDNHVNKDVSWRSGLASDKNLIQSGWGNHLADLDNDGFLDLVSNNGLLTKHSDSSYISQGQHKQIWFNQRGKTAFDLATLWEADKPDIISTAMPGRAVVSFDYDNDGDSDLLWTHNNQQLQIFENTLPRSKSNWIGLQLTDSSGVNNPPQSQVTITLKNGDKRYYHSATNNGFLAQSDPRYLIGLGEQTLQSVTITWPNGEQKTVAGNDIQTNNYATIQQNQAKIHHKTIQEKNNKPASNSLYNSPNYASWLALHPNAEHLNQKILIKHYQQANTDEKIALIKKLSDQPSTVLLALLQQALTDKPPQLQQLAIKTLQSLEYQPATYWLIGLLENPNTYPSSLCHTARSFQFYFNQEEALSHLKNLAITPLVNLLRHPNDQVKVCATNALGEAQSYRAALELEQLAGKSIGKVKITAVQNLGLIREGRSHPVLMGLFNDISNSAAVRVAAFEALQNFDTSLIELDLKLIFATITSAQELLELGELIYPANRLNQQVYSTASKQLFINQLRQFNTDKLSEAQTIRLLALAPHTNTRDAIVLLKPFLNNKNLNIKQQAYQSLAIVPGDQSRRLFFTDIDKTSSLASQQYRLQLAAQHGLTPSSSQLTSWFSNSALAFSLAPLISKHHHQTGRDILSNLLNTPIDNTTSLLQVLNSCAALRNYRNSDAARYYTHHLLAVRLAAAACVKTHQPGQGHKTFDFLHEAISNGDSDLAAIAFAALPPLLQQQFWLKSLNDKSLNIADYSALAKATAWQQLPSPDLVIKRLLSQLSIAKLALLQAVIKDVKLPLSAVDKLWQGYSNPAMALHLRLSIGDILIAYQPQRVIALAYKEANHE